MFRWHSRIGLLREESKHSTSRDCSMQIAIRKTAIHHKTLSTSSALPHSLGAGLGARAGNQPIKPTAARAKTASPKPPNCQYLATGRTANQKPMSNCEGGGHKTSCIKRRPLRLRHRPPTRLRARSDLGAANVPRIVVLVIPLARVPAGALVLRAVSAAVPAAAAAPPGRARLVPSLAVVLGVAAAVRLAVILVVVVVLVVLVPVPILAPVARPAALVVQVVPNHLLDRPPDGALPHARERQVSSAAPPARHTRPAIRLRGKISCWGSGRVRKRWGCREAALPLIRASQY